MLTGLPTIAAPEADQLPAAVDSATIEGRLADYAEDARGAYASNTERAIKGDTALFAGWCAERGLVSLPPDPDTVRAFVDHCAEQHATATIRRRVSSIAHMHRAAGLDDPTKDSVVKLAMKRLARSK